MNEKKQSILDASLKLFVENGFHGTSTAEIAKTAEVATGTLFHYFKTKEELIKTGSTPIDFVIISLHFPFILTFSKRKYFGLT